METRDINDPADGEPVPLEDADLAQAVGGLSLLITSGDSCNVCGSNLPPVDFGYGADWRSH